MAVGLGKAAQKKLIMSLGEWDWRSQRNYSMNNCGTGTTKIVFKNLDRMLTIVFPGFTLLEYSQDKIHEIKNKKTILN